MAPFACFINYDYMVKIMINGALYTSKSEQLWLRYYFLQQFYLHTTHVFVKVYDEIIYIIIAVWFVFLLRNFDLILWF